MFRLIRQIVVSTVCLALLLCLAYPLSVTAVGKVFFPKQAAGSLVYEGNTPIGSALLGQAFSEDRFFHPRPSAVQYDGHTSGGSNLGPTSPVLAERFRKDAEALHRETSVSLEQTDSLSNETASLCVQGRPLPVDRLTASGSGLDPHLSPEGALMQVPRVAQARQLPVAQVRELVEAQIEGPEWGLFGEPRVNVLLLNKALDALH